QRFGCQLSRSRFARARSAPFQPAFERARRHPPVPAHPALASALRPAPILACAVTSDAAKNGRSEWTWGSCHSLAGRVVATGLVALVELIAAHLALRLGTIIGVHERLH